MARWFNREAVRAFVESRMPGYYRAVSSREERQWLAELDEELEHLSRGWTQEEASEFGRLVQSEMRAIRLEMRMAGPEAVAERYGVVLPERRTRPLIIAGAAALVVLIIALIVFG